MSTLSITTNTSALSVQRNLSKANDRSATSLSKLSSGSRVPTAKDDAASLAIGSRLQAEIAGLNQASVNASQATSMLQIADGALSEINSILVRMKSLSVQASSGQLSDVERGLLDSEYQELKGEIDRITNDTEFNGNSLLKGGDIESTTNELQTGDLASGGIKISYNSNIVDGKADTNGDGTYDHAGHVFAIDYDTASKEITLTNKSTGEIITKNIEADLDKKAGTGNNLAPGQEMDVLFADMGITVTLTDDFDRGVDYGNLSATAKDGTAAAPTYAGMKVTEGSGVLTSTQLEALAAVGAYDPATSMITLTLTETTGAVTVKGTGLEFSVNGGVTGATSSNIVAAGAGTIDVKLASGESLFTIETTSITAGGADGTSTLEIPLQGYFGAQEDSLGTATFDFQVGTGTKSSDRIAVSVDGATTTSLGINSSSINSKTTANNAIDEVGNAIDKLQDIRAKVGASLSRLEFASSNLSVAIENSQSAKSGLLDVDVASETTKYTAEQVIVQAGVSLLAQANQRPNTLLKLLQQ